MMCTWIRLYVTVIYIYWVVRHDDIWTYIRLYVTIIFVFGVWKSMQLN